MSGLPPFPGDSDEVRGQIDALHSHDANHLVGFSTNGTHVSGSLHFEEGTNGEGLAVDEDRDLADNQKYIYDNYADQTNELFGPDAHYWIDAGKKLSWLTVQLRYRSLLSQHRDHVHWGVYKGFKAKKPPATPGPKESDMIGVLKRTKSGKGYWQVKQDGGLFNHGDAKLIRDKEGNFNPVGKIQTPVTGFDVNDHEDGSIFVTMDGAVYCFGTTPYKGGANDHKDPNRKIVDVQLTPSGKGYWLMGKDGAIFSFGDATFYGGSN